MLVGAGVLLVVTSMLESWVDC